MKRILNRLVSIKFLYHQGFLLVNGYSHNIEVTWEKGIYKKQFFYIIILKTLNWYSH